MSARDSRKNSRTWMRFWPIALTLLMAIGTVWLRLLIIRTTYAIHQTDKSIQNLGQEREIIELKLAALKSPRKLESLARQRFGLSQPSSTQVIHFKQVMRQRP